MKHRRIDTIAVLLAAACAARGTLAAPPAARTPAPPAAPAPASAPTAASAVVLPAAIADANAVLDAARILRNEVDAVTKLPPGTMRDARAAYRRLAFDLLFHGAQAPAGAQAMAVAGLRLAAAREPLDRLLERQLPPGASGVAVQDALARFAKSAEHGLEPLPAPDHPEATLAAALRPLREAVAILEAHDSTLPGTAWPTIDKAPRAFPPTDPAPRPDGDPNIADAQRTGSIPVWVEVIGAARAQSRPAFEAASQQWASSLHDPQRRDAVRRSMDDFAREVVACQPAAFERSLRRGDPPAIAAAAGRATDLVRELDARRGAWAQAWSNGKGSPEASLRLVRAVRVAESLAAIAGTPPTDGGERRLGAWGGCLPPDNAWSVHGRAAAARAVLALEALCDGKEAEVDAELAKLDVELPPVLFAGRMLAVLDPWLTGRSGIGALLAAAADSPADDAFLGPQRADLMLIARCMAEESRAERLRQDDALAAVRTLAADRESAVLGCVDMASGRLAALRTLQGRIAERAAETVPAGRRR